jgi:hypothetical protein
MTYSWVPTGPRTARIEMPPVWRFPLVLQLAALDLGLFERERDPLDRALAGLFASTPYA